ncbi:MAG: phosphohistidine phosphatase SixA [Deltaproteobacteria bacterium]|nr:phosphohistidine phosphatase SixA [Deltaproteobacteria bacterium]
MRLYLVQHGQSKREEEDPQRGLTDKGVADLERVAAFVQPLGLTVSAVWHSGKTRALQTAEILSRALSPGKGVIQHTGLAPLDPVWPIAEEIGALSEDLMIVGHLPFLGSLASLLVSGSETTDLVAFQQGGIVCFEKEEKLGWRFRWMVTPDLLGSVSPLR